MIAALKSAADLENLARCVDKDHTAYHDAEAEVTKFKVKGEYIYGTGLLLFAFAIMVYGYKYSDRMLGLMNGRSNGYKFAPLPNEDGDVNIKPTSRHQTMRKGSVEMSVII